MNPSVTLSLPADAGRDTGDLLRRIEAETGATPGEVTHGAADVFRFTAPSMGEAEDIVDGIGRALTELGEARACIVLTATDGKRTHFHAEGMK